MQATAIHAFPPGMPICLSADWYSKTLQHLHHKNLDARRCVRRTTFFYVFESGVLKRTKPIKNIGMSADVCVVKNFSMFRRLVFTNIAHSVQKTLVRRSVRSTTIFKVFESGVQKQNKTTKTKLLFSQMYA